jgi:tetratricopeptide (TPR) repeat protein
MHKSKDAVEYLGKLIGKEPNEDKWYRALHLMYQAKLEQPKLIQLLQETVKKNKNLTAMLYLADIYLKKKEFNNAVELLHSAHTLTQQKPLQAKILYQIGIIYYETNQPQKLSAVIDDAEELETDFVPLQNLIAYYYAHKSRNLEKAQEYIEKVLAQEPDNIHYLDTQAYIFYQKKEFAKAHEILTSLEKKGPKDYFILKHTSKVLKHLGKKEEALAYVDKALQVVTLDLQKTKLLQLKKIW